jgi:ketosteroid isomerase-like protein
VASAPQSSDPVRTEQAREAIAEPPTAVLQRFVVAYERGDLEALMALFDQDARIERGGRARIRSDYDALFRDSEMRSLRLRDLRWSGEGEVVRGEAAFVARVLRRGEADLREVAGSIRVELVRRGNRLLIIGLYHTAG